jgi:hypothetical protein
MAISNVCIPYSWANITSKNNNNKFTFVYPYLATTQSFTLTLEDGWYSIVDINSYLQRYCIANGFYLIDQNGNNVFYLTLLYNPTYYAVQIIINAVPTSLPSGWTQPSNWTGFPTTSLTAPTIQFGAGMAKIVGYTTSVVGFGTSVGNQSYLSSSTPQGSIVNSLVIRSNLVDNECGFPTDILDTMPITSSYGTNLVYSPTELKWVSCTAGTFQSFEIYFCDQNYNQIYALDNNVCISILLKNSGKPMTSLVPLTFKE